MSEAAAEAQADNPPAEKLRKRRRRRRVVAGLLAAWALMFLTFGCTSTVTPPTNPIDPVEVFVLSEAMHTGIVLPPDPGSSGNPDQYVEFGFGDWNWYALSNNAWNNAFATVLWPTQGALGRRTFGARKNFAFAPVGPRCNQSWSVAKRLLCYVAACSPSLTARASWWSCATT